MLVLSTVVQDSGMRSTVCVLSALYLLLQPGASLPADTASSPQPSYGTIVAQDLANSGAIITQNLQGGVVAIADPLIKFAVDTAPDLAHLYAILNGYDIPAPLAALAKDIYRRMAVLSGKTLNRVGVFGSEVAAGGMNIGASGLGALNNVVEAGALAGIKLGGKIADIAVDATQTGSTVVAGGLTSGGDGMLTAAAAARIHSQRISKMVDEIGSRIALGITSAESFAAKFLDDFSTVLKNGVIKFNNKQQERVYKVIQSYLSTLRSMQDKLNDLVVTVQRIDSKPLSVTGDVKSSRLI